MTEEQRFARDLASFEQEQGFYKHLTTLSSGAILLMVTFINELFPRPAEWGWLVAVSLVSFTICIVSSLFLWAASSKYVSTPIEKSLPKVAAVLGLIGLVCSYVGFLTGMVSLVIFALKNLY